MQTNNTDLDKACSAFSMALAKNEFCYNEAMRTSDRQAMKYYENNLKWKRAVASIR